MSGYSKMEASPFWMKVLRVTGVLCLLTLMLPSIYYVKYLVIDYPSETRLARSLPLTTDPVAGGAKVSRIQWYIKDATCNSDPNLRAGAVRELGAMVALPAAQVLYPVECLNAKLTIGQVAHSDPDPQVKQAAAQIVDQVMSHGIVLQR